MAIPGSTLATFQAIGNREDLSDVIAVVKALEK